VADERDVANEVALAAAARHALHDEELVAAYAADGLESDGEIAQARALVERCTVCRDLHRDVAAIGAALAVEARFAIAAPSDFRLTVDDAHRLGGRVMTRGLGASLRRALDGFARPVGATLATFGVIGVLIGSLALGGGGTAGSLAASAAPNAPAEIQSGAAQPGPKASSTDAAFGPIATDDGTRTGADGERDLGSAGSSPIAWLLLGSFAMLLAGVALLFVAVRRGRRPDARP
jgi:hypothetical protein